MHFIPHCLTVSYWSNMILTPSEIFKPKSFLWLHPFITNVLCIILYSISLKYSLTYLVSMETFSTLI